MHYSKKQLVKLGKTKASTETRFLDTEAISNMKTKKPVVKGNQIA